MTSHLFRSPTRLLVGFSLVALALPLAVFFFSSTAPLQSADQVQPDVRFTLRPGEHISIIGNTLADRMQHDGWLETFLHSRFPKHQLTIRNLGFSGDEITTRLRSANFGSPDEWLTRNSTDIVFAFFGYNESFAGKEGLDKFKKDLANLHQEHPGAKKYNGRATPGSSSSRPSPTRTCIAQPARWQAANNRRLVLYTDAMAEVAKTQGSLRRSVPPHADPVCQGQDATDHPRNPPHGRGKSAPCRDHRRSPLPRQAGRRAAVPKPWPPAQIDSGEEPLLVRALPHHRWLFDLWRAGGPTAASTSFRARPTARSPMRREMAILDVMTANRDKVVWAVAQKAIATVDDNNTPPFLPIKTNKPGPVPAASSHLPRPREGHREDDRRQGDENR